MINENINNLATSLNLVLRELPLLEKKTPVIEVSKHHDVSKNKLYGIRTIKNI